MRLPERRARSPRGMFGCGYCASCSLPSPTVHPTPPPHHTLLLVKVPCSIFLVSRSLPRPRLPDVSIDVRFTPKKRTVRFVQYEDNGSGGFMSCAARMDDDAIIAFLLFCLEEQRRR